MAAAGGQRRCGCESETVAESTTTGAALRSPIPTPFMYTAGAFKCLSEDLPAERRDYPRQCVPRLDRWLTGRRARIMVGSVREVRMLPSSESPINMALPPPKNLLDS